jgi:hypothetical protein
LVLAVPDFQTNDISQEILLENILTQGIDSGNIPIDGFAYSAMVCGIYGACQGRIKKLMISLQKSNAPLSEIY